MKLFTAKHIAYIDSQTIALEPISSTALMERASYGFTLELLRCLNSQKSFYIICGPGNNGGDGLAVARFLAETTKIVTVFLPQNPQSDDCKEMYNKLLNLQSKNITIIQSQTIKDINIPEDTVIIDALFGTGLNRELTADYSKIISFINTLQNKIVSLDIPSGMYSNKANSTTDSIVNATVTISFEFPKIAFFMPENQEYVGEIKVVPIGLHLQTIDSLETNYNTIDKNNLFRIKRKTAAHKGNFGHALLIAGSKGMAGAATLCTQACLRAGAGLVTAYVPEGIEAVIQTNCLEAMTKIDEGFTHITTIPKTEAYSVLAIGPGLGTHADTISIVEKFLEQPQIKVIDADGLNCISLNQSHVKKINSSCVLTPHPGEFDRLFGKHTSGYERLQTQIQKSKELQCTIVLKGAHTSVSFANGDVYFNTSGNPGMATAGSGDVLTGIITALLAQKYSIKDAVLLGVYIHGLAADFALENNTHETLIASDIIKNLYKAFNHIVTK